MSIISKPYLEWNKKEKKSQPSKIYKSTYLPIIFPLRGPWSRVPKKLIHQWHVEQHILYNIKIKKLKKNPKIYKLFGGCGVFSCFLGFPFSHYCYCYAKSMFCLSCPFLSLSLCFSLYPLIWQVSNSHSLIIWSFITQSNALIAFC